MSNRAHTCQSVGIAAGRILSDDARSLRDHAALPHGAEWFHRDHRHRIDRSRRIFLDDARFTIHVEHGDIALKSGRTPAPADKAKSPRKIEISVVDNGGWRTTADCSADLSQPVLDDLGVVTLMQRCEITRVNGDDTGRVSLDIYGDGRAAALGGFGRADLH